MAIKALTTSTATWRHDRRLLSPWLLTCIAASVIAFYASARGLQKGEAVPVITLTSAAANVTAISGGILVFGDPMPNDPVGIVLQSFAFVLVIVAAALTPAPLRAHAPRASARPCSISSSRLVQGRHRGLFPSQSVVRAAAGMQGPLRFVRFCAWL